MNMSTETTKRAETSLTRDWINFSSFYLQPYLGGRRGLLIMAVAVLVIAGALNWSWLVAIGIAPLLIAIAPCAVMCALGVCMSRMGGHSCSSQSSVADRERGAQSSASHRDAETQSEPVTTLSDPRAGGLTEDRPEDSEERVAARRKSEAASGKG